MSTEATSKFKIDSWDERPYLETSEGRKLTRADATQLKARSPGAHRRDSFRVLPTAT